MKHVLERLHSLDGSEMQVTLYDDSTNTIEVKKVLTSAVIKDANLKPTARDK